MAKGDIVLAKSIRAEPNTTTLEITIPVTDLMAPKARLIVYYVRAANTELVADALNFKVDGSFKTSVTLSSNVNQTKPGGNVDIQVDTRPSAYVGLLGVDQSVLLLKTGNDITKDSVMQELEGYDTGKRYDYPGGNWFFRSMFWSSSSTAGELFDDSGVVVFTNGLMFREIRYRSYSKIAYASAVRVGNYTKIYPFFLITI